MSLAMITLAIAIVALLGLIVHVLIPTPPAHTMNPFGVRSGSLAASS